MKLTILTLIISISLFANSKNIDENLNSLGFEALFLKIASEAFFSEYEDGKSVTYSNQKRVQKLEKSLKDIQTFLSKLSEMKQQLDREAEDLKRTKQQLFSILKELSSSEKSPNIEVNNLFKRDEDITYLKKEIDNLKNMLDLMRKNIKKEKKISSKTPPKIETIFKDEKLKVIAQSANIRLEPFLDSNISGELKQNSIIEIESCDRYGWCKLKNSEGFVAKYLFEVIE